MLFIYFLKTISVLKYTFHFCQNNQKNTLPFTYW